MWVVLAVQALPSLQTPHVHASDGGVPSAERGGGSDVCGADGVCEMHKTKEKRCTREGVHITRKGSIVWIAGKLARTVRQVGRA